MRLTGICNVRRPTTSSPTNVSLPPCSCTSSSVAPLRPSSPLRRYSPRSLVRSFTFSRWPFLFATFCCPHFLFSQVDLPWRVARTSFIGLCATEKEALPKNDGDERAHYKLFRANNEICNCTLFRNYRAFMRFSFRGPISHRDLPLRSAAVCSFRLVFLATLLRFLSPFLLLCRPCFARFLSLGGWRINHIKVREIYFPRYLGCVVVLSRVCTRVPE